MKQKQVAEIESRHLVRVMLFLSWLSFMAAMWLGWFNPAWWIFAGFWLLVVFILMGVLASDKTVK